MAKNQANLNFGINFNVNTASLNNVKQSLEKLRKMSKEEIEKAGGKILPLSDMKTKSWTNDLGAMRKELTALEKALEAAYNPKLGTYELNKFNQALKESNTSAQRAFETISAYGRQGELALLNMTTNMLAVDRAAKQTHSTFQKLGETMMNTIRWSITSTAINTVTGAIQKAYGYAVDLDKSLNDIMIVTDKSAGDMENFARQANKAAKALGSTTTEYTEASLIYYQQGLSDKDVAARSDVTLKAAAVTGQSAQQVSEQLTAVWNGYKVSAEESEVYIDKLAAVAATTAADLEELSTGMSKVASAANVMGVDVDQLNAQLATIVSVTREAPESIGTALKTVYARMSDIEAGLDTETTLGEYTAQMAQMGIDVLDANGKLRDMGAVVEEIGGKWSSLNREQQVSLAQSIAGTRQYSRMMALFDNWDMYEEAMTTSLESAGTLSKQHLEYLDSIEAHQNQLKASAEGLYDSIFDSDEIKGVYDLLSGIVVLVDELVQSMGGMPGILATVGMLFAKSAKHSIADLITKQATNRLNEHLYKKQIEEGKAFIAIQKESIKNNSDLSQHLQQVLDFEDQIYANAENLTDSQWKELQRGVNAYNESVQTTIKLEQELQDTQSEYQKTFQVGQGVTGYLQSVTDKDGNQKNIFHRKTTTIGGKDYWLGSEEDSTTKDGKTKLGLISAQQRKFKLEEIKTQRKLNAEEEIEYDQLKLYIPLAQKENQIRQKNIQVTQNNVQAINQSKQATDDQKIALEQYLQSMQRANKITAVIDGLTSIAFTATTAAASITSFNEAIHDAEAGAMDYIGAIGGIVAAFAPMGVTLFKTVIPGLKGIKAGTITGAAAWQTYWAAATLGISLVITGLTTIFSIIDSNNKALIESEQKSIDNAKAKQEEAQANKDLATSYLNLYDIYKSTGNGQEELEKSAQELIDKLQKEEYEVFLLRKEYDALAEAIGNYRIEESQAKKQQAEKEKKAAGNILEAKTVGNTAGISNNWLYGDIFSTLWTEKVISQGLSDTDEGINAKILKEHLGEFAYDTDSGEIGINWPESAEDMVDFYRRLESATTDPQWKSKNSELHTNVQKILNDTDLQDAVESYESANKSSKEESILQSISEDSLSRNTSLADFSSQRQEKIDELVSTGDYNEEEAKSIVDNQYKEFGGVAADLLEREELLIAYQKDLGEAKTNELRSLMGFDNLSKAEFAALDMLDLKELSKKSADDIIATAKEKALEIQDEFWAGMADDRLSSLETKFNELGKVINRTFGTDKANKILEQNKLLEQQANIIESTIEVQKKAVSNKKEELLKVASKYEIADDLNLESLMASGDWEAIGANIDNITSPDVQNELYKALQNVIKADNELVNSSAELYDIQDQLIDQRIAYFEASFEGYDLELEYLNKIADSYRSMSELNKLIEGERNYDAQATYAQQILTAAESAESFAKARFEEAEAVYNAIKDDSSYSDEEKKEALDRMVAYSEEYANAVTATVEAAQGKYVADTMKMFNSFEKDLMESDFDRDLAKSDWDWTMREDEQYLDDIEKLYGIEDVQDAFEKAMGSTSSLKVQNQIKDLMDDELDLLKERDKLTQYDLDRAYAKLEVLQAEIALQDAQDAKTEMRLMRGADGVYSYQYVADQNNIREKEQAVRDANLNLYQLDKENLQDATEEWWNLYDELRSKALEMYAKGYSEEEIERLLKPGLDQLSDMGKNIGTWSTGFEKDVSDISANLSSIGEEAGKLINNQATQFVQAFGSAEYADENGNKLTGAQKLMQNIIDKYEDYTAKVGEKQTAVNAAFGGMNTELQGIISKLSQMTGSEMITKLDALIKKAEEAKTATNDITPSENGNNDNPGNGSEGGSGGGGFSPPSEAANGYFDGINKFEPQERDGETYYIYDLKGNKIEIADNELNNHRFSVADAVDYYMINGEEYALVQAGKTKTGMISGLVTQGEEYYFPLHNMNKLNSGAWYFDTGGYTGEWGDSSGRLAMLHEKEIVLNKQDTANFLDGIQILRTLNMSMLNTLAGMSKINTPNISNINTSNEESNIEQQVTIHADFSGVQNAKEIEEAFDNLVNLALQHANEDVWG